jgi:hypothetical protein
MDTSSWGRRWRRPNFLGVIALTALMIVPALPGAADDGDRVLKRISPDEFATTEAEAEHVFTNILKFYVPTQRASGEVLDGPGVHEHRRRARGPPAGPRSRWST